MRALIKRIYAAYQRRQPTWLAAYKASYNNMRMQ